APRSARANENRATVSTEEPCRTRSGNGQSGCRSVCAGCICGRTLLPWRPGVWGQDQLLAGTGSYLLLLAAGGNTSEDTWVGNSLLEKSGRLTPDSQPGHHASGQSQPPNRAGGPSGALRGAELYWSDLVLLPLAASEGFTIHRHYSEQQRGLGRF